VAVFDRLVTETAQRGFYIVYLFRGDGSAVSLSLGQGTTEVLQLVGRSNYLDELKARAKSFASLLSGQDASGLDIGPIDLGGSGDLARLPAGPSARPDMLGHFAPSTDLRNVTTRAMSWSPDQDRAFARLDRSRPGARLGSSRESRVVMPRYPVVITQGQERHDRAVDADALSAQVVAIRDAFLKLFNGIPARSRGELDRVEIGLALTDQGDIAFAAGNTTPSMTLVLRVRQRSLGRSATPRASATKEPVVVEID
jgi:hypothetical protein